VSREELGRLVGGALAQLYPSLYEGFGMPVLEAMACGTPVITSTSSSLPEVAGGAAVLADPTSVDSIAHAICMVANDASLRADLRDKGIARARQFSWERAAKETLAIYHQLLRE
jgi:glycosyltransferase involved in cell wall biosynthesis